MYLILLNFFVILLDACSTEKIRFISTERPKVTYYNLNYISYANLTSRRYGRKDIFYYVGLNMYFVNSVGNNVSVDFYFYEFLTNRYRRGFVEMHFKFCDLIEKDEFFGSSMRQGNFAKPCPFPAGPYNLSNMTIPVKNIPHNFPFTKGRIYCNLSATVSREILGSGYIDMEIKEARLKSRSNGV